MLNAELLKYRNKTKLQQVLPELNKKHQDFVKFPAVLKANNKERQKVNRIRSSVLELPQIKFAPQSNVSKSFASTTTLNFPSVATVVSITGLLPDYKQFLKSELTTDSVKLASFNKRLKKLQVASNARTRKKSQSPFYSFASTLHRKKLPKLNLSAGDSSTDTSTFDQTSLLPLSFSNPTKSQSLPGLEKLKQLDYLLANSKSFVSLATSECNEGMNTSKQHQKRVPPQFERTMRLTEQRSYANLTSSFTVPTVGRVSVSRKTHLRSSKSFHGDAGNVISDVTVRASHGGDREKATMSHSTALSNGYAILRQPQSNNRKLSERQRNKILKPLTVSKNQAAVTKELASDFCSAILPDSSTASYRLTHDVSFDEGSRYRGSVTVPFVFKNGEEARDGTQRRKSSFSTSEDQRRSPHNSARIELLSDHSNRRPPTSHIQTLTLKEPISYTFLRGEDRSNLKSASRGISPHTGSPTYYQSSSPNGIPFLKNSKDARSSWNSKYGDLSISGGNFSNTGPSQTIVRSDPSVMNAVAVNPTPSYAQKISFRSLSREKSVTSPNRPRFSSTKSRTESSPSYIASCKEFIYADPCIGAPPSFHQRLNELSLLEAETIKYEKNRKFKRKPKSDKDS